MVKQTYRAWLASVTLLVAAIVPGQRGLPAELDTARDQDPPLAADEAVKTVARFDPRLKTLWLEALARPEADLQRQAADAIARAQALGMPDLGPTVPHLLKVMQATGAHPSVRLSAAKALIALDARQTAAALMERAKADGFTAARLLEPALARWDYAPMRPEWLARLADLRTPPGPLILAIQAAAVVKLDMAAPELRRLVLDPKQAGDVRLEAARALAVLRSAGLEADAGRLAEDGSPQKMLDRLAAAVLLSQHRGPAAEKLLLKLAAAREPAVATAAVQRLVDVAAARLEPLLPALIVSPDAGLRLLGARALAELQTAEAAGRLGSLLDDPHREVRLFAQKALIRLAGVEPLSKAVRAAVMKALATGGPAGLEQAAVAAGALRHEPAAEHLVKMLGYADPEVRSAAAWGLRRLAVPATAAAILETARTDTDKPRAPPRRALLPGADSSEEGLDPHGHLGHLLEALGVMRHRPALPLLSRYLPMPPMPRPPGDNPLWRPELRAAAIWSLGLIGEAAPPPDLVATLRKRLSGEPIEPGAKQKREDAAVVRAMAAVSLGRMKAKEAAPELRQIYQDEKELPRVRRACAWALERLTGEKVPELKLSLKPREVWYSGWFLEPLNGPP